MGEKEREKTERERERWRVTEWSDRDKETGRSSPFFSLKVVSALGHQREPKNEGQFARAIKDIYAHRRNRLNVIGLLVNCA